MVLEETKININVDPFTVDAGDDKTIICGGTALLDGVTSNFTGTGTLTYAWSPTTGLDNSTVLNPRATVINNTNYTVTVLTPNGCQSKDSLVVSMQSMNSPSICMVGVDSANKNLIIWAKPVSTSIDSFYIYKETHVTNEYQKIGKIYFRLIMLSGSITAMIPAISAFFIGRRLIGFLQPAGTNHLLLTQEW